MGMKIDLILILITHLLLPMSNFLHNDSTYFHNTLIFFFQARNTQSSTIQINYLLLYISTDENKGI